MNWPLPNPPQYPGDPPVQLTATELRVLRRVARGEVDYEIAFAEFWSIHTARDYVKRIRLKLGASNKCAAVWRALELGLIEPPEAP